MIEFSHFSFRYKSQKEATLHDIDLVVRDGEKILIAGASGSGKSTLGSCINGLIPHALGGVIEGSLKVGGHETRESGIYELSKSVGTVLQDNYLMAGSARWNVSMGRPFSDAEVEDACRKAHVHSIIERLSDGYDTLLDDDAGLLSAGERQLLSIARCMIDLPSLLILDEATSSIDTRTERLVQEAFNQMMEGRTSFVVAHRLSTIRRADKILVLRDGAVVEMGRHEDLLERGGFYSELYKSQFAFQEQT